MGRIIVYSRIRGFPTTAAGLVSSVAPEIENLQAVQVGHAEACVKVWQKSGPPKKVHELCPRVGVYEVTHDIGTLHGQPVS